MTHKNPDTINTSLRLCPAVWTHNMTSRQSTCTVG